MGNDDAAHIKTNVFKLIAQTQYIFVISYAEVSTNFIFLNVVSTDYHDDFSLVTKLQEHLQFAIRLETGKHATGVIIIKEFASKFEVKFISEFGNALLDAF